MSFSIGLKHADNTITWLYDFEMYERMFHDFTEFFTTYMRIIFNEKTNLTGWDVRKVYEDFNWLFGINVATIIINPDFYTYDLKDLSLLKPVASGTLFISCKVGNTFEYVNLHSHEDDDALEDMLKRANIMNANGAPDAVSIQRLTMQSA
jgi:hypothetical protein